MTQVKASPDKKTRVQVMLRWDELTALDDWRFANRMPSRLAAVRELLRRGIAGPKNGRPLRPGTGS
jgi:hypothetical protein